MGTWGEDSGWCDDWLASTDMLLSSLLLTAERGLKVTGSTESSLVEFLSRARPGMLDTPHCCQTCFINTTQLGESLITSHYASLLWFSAVLFSSVRTRPHITSESAPAEPRPSYYFPHQIHQQDSSVGEGSSWWIRMFEHLPKSTLMIQSHSNCNIILSCICEGSFCNLSKVSISIQKKIKKGKVFASFLMKTFYLKVFLKYYPIIFPLSVKRCSLPWTFESGEEL